MTRYYCSGFDINNAFGHGLGTMFKKELKNKKSIVYIPGGADRIEKAKNKYIPAFTNHFKNIGIEFDNIILITPDMDKEQAKKEVREANFIMLMGGDPSKQKKLCEEINIIEELKAYDGLMLGYSAGAMLMSKYIIITPCSEEYPDFHIEKGLNLDGISIYPHNNTNQEEYPNEIVAGDETYQKEDLIRVAKDYGEFYLLQDYLRDDGLTDASMIKSTNGDIELYIENNGKLWLATPTDIVLSKSIKR